MDLYKIPIINRVFDKKNRFDYIQIIPKGLDCYILVEYNNVFNFYHVDDSTDTPLLNKIPFLKKRIPRVNIPNVLFKGIIINQKLVSITDVIYLNRSLYVTNYDKLHILKNIFNTNVCLYKNDVMIFSIPHMFNNMNSYKLEHKSIPYEVNHVEYKYFNHNIIRDPIQFYNNPINYIINKTGEYYVMADIMSDVYKLYNDNNVFIGFAHIPTYSLSVYMNSIFRNIKENRNLDSLEESDDESDFENNEPNKYVDLSKRIKMKCIFNERFKKWIPNIIIV
jgi:hypothetical protein